MTCTLDWPTLERRDWKRRNAAFESAVRQYLAALPASETLSTAELAAALIEHPDGRHHLASFLTRLAKWTPALATHDGEVFIAFGKEARRWRWHGQATPPA